MAIKYAKKWKLFLFLIISILDSFQSVFLAYLLKVFISFAQKPTGNLLGLTLFAISGLIIFSIIGILFQYSFLNLIHDINIKIKEIATDHIVNINDQANLDTSFMTNDLKQIETSKVVAELKIFNYILKFLTAIITAVITSWFISLVFFIAAIIPALVQNFAGKKISANSKKWERANSNYTATVTETINGTTIFSLYNSENSIAKRLIKSARKMEDALQSTNLSKGIANELTSFAAYCFGMIIPFSVGVYLITIGNITLSTFMMIVQLSNNFVNPIVNIFMCVNDIKMTTPIWTKFIKIQKYKRQASDNSSIPVFNNLSLINATIYFDKQTIFQKVNLVIKKGEKILLQAPSGWGKSTLLKVLIGKYKLDLGSYLINGEKASGNWNKDHELFALINQQPFILNDTIEYNITLGQKVTKQELNKVVAKAGLEELVRKKGYHYQVGLGGKNLSGGQNQRIEIARALLKKRQILLADEATSSLDTKLSRKIHATFLKEFSGTVIEVAHHISTDEASMFDRKIDLEANKKSI